MKIGININENNQVIVAYPNGDIDGDIGVEVNEITFNNIFNESIPYKYIDEELIIDTAKQNYESKEQEILELKQKLADTDYVSNKLIEYQYLELEVPEELDRIIRDRQLWRERINEIEEEMNPLF